jgi:hypothetical protein
MSANHLSSPAPGSPHPEVRLAKENG